MAAPYQPLSGVMYSAHGPVAGVRLAFSVVDDRGRPVVVPSGIPGLVLVGTVADAETDAAGAFAVELLPTVGRGWRYKLEGKRDNVAQLKRLGSSGTVWLATDLDREGEAIAWHLLEILGGDRDKPPRGRRRAPTRQAQRGR